MFLGNDVAISMRNIGLPLSVDWFAMTLSLKSFVREAPMGHVWAKYSPTNVWGSRWALFNDHGEKVFTLLFNPRSSIISSDRALLEVANEWLYHGLGISGCLRLLSQSVGFEIMGISRIDLAVDFTPDDVQVEIIKALGCGSMYVAGKQNRVPWFQSITDNWFPAQWLGETPYDQTWGHKTTDVRWKLYYKSKELRDNAGGVGYDKPYIVDMWREVGLDERNTWRLEVSIHNANQFIYMGERLGFYDFMHSTPDIYKALYTDRFVIRKREGHKDKSNDTKVDFLPIGRLHGAFRKVRSETIAEHHGSLTLLRHLVADAQTEEVMMNDMVRESVIATIGNILENDGISKYFNIITGESFENWVESLRVRAYYFGCEYDGRQELTKQEKKLREIRGETLEAGERHRMSLEDIGEKMERVLMESGLVMPSFVPLDSSSSLVSPSGARQEEQLKLNYK